MPTDENRRLSRATLNNAAKYTNFSTLITHANAYLATNDNATRLMVPAAQLAEMTAAAVAYGPALALYVNPTTRTRAVIAEVEAQYQNAKPVMSALQQQLKNNANITLTGDDHTALQIHIDKTTRTRVPVQTVVPLVEAYDIKHMETRFRTAYPDSGGDFHRRLPAYNSLLIKTAFTAADAPAPTAADYDHITMSGRNRFTVTPPPNTVVGSLGYVKCCYVNSRGETGPDSTTLKFLVN